MRFGRRSFEHYRGRVLGAPPRTADAALASSTTERRWRTRNRRGTRCFSERAQRTAMLALYAPVASMTRSQPTRIYSLQD